MFGFDRFPNLFGFPKNNIAKPSRAACALPEVAGQSRAVEIGLKAEKPMKAKK
jgi:hypothetical protein